MKRNITAFLFFLLTIIMLVACNTTAEMDIEGGDNLCDDENYSIVLDKIVKSDRNYSATFVITNTSDRSVEFNFEKIKTDSDFPFDIQYDESVYLAKGDSEEFTVTINGTADNLSTISELVLNVVVKSDTTWDYTITLEDFGGHSITWGLDAFEVVESDRL